MPTLFISKLEAAERQLIEAINLFFERRDEIAIHTLVGASHQILLDIAKLNGKYIGLLKDGNYIREEKRKEYFKKINGYRNFFKHGERDVEKTLKFNTELNEFWILDAIEIHKHLTIHKFIYEFLVFSHWFISKRPDFLADSFRIGFEKNNIKLVEWDDFESIRETLSDSDLKAKMIEVLHSMNEKT